MKRLIIVGAGGFGREVLAIAKTVKEQKKEWEIGGFLDDDPSALDGYQYNLPIVGNINDYVPKEGDCFVMGIESPRNKLSISQRLLQRGAEIVSLIHPTAEIGGNVRFGIGLVLCPHSGISCDVTLGNFVTLNAHAAIGHDAVIGDGCTLSAFSHVSGLVKMGKGVYVGIHGCILPGIKIGDYATIAAGSVSIKNVKSETTVMGVPAKRI